MILRAIGNFIGEMFEACAKSGHFRVVESYVKEGILHARVALAPSAEHVVLELGEELGNEPSNEPAWIDPAELAQAITKMVQTIVRDLGLVLRTLEDVRAVVALALYRLFEEVGVTQSKELAAEFVVEKNRAVTIHTVELAAKLEALNVGPLAT